MTEPEEANSGYAQAVASLHATAKWLVAAGAAVATTLLASVNLRGVTLAALSTTEQLVAASAALVAYALAISLVLGAARVLATPRLSLNDLSDKEMAAGGVTTSVRLEPVADETVQYILERRTDLLCGEETITGFYAHARTPRPSPEASKDAQAVGERRAWAAQARVVEDAAQYHQTRRCFETLRQFLLLGAVLFAISVLVFVWVAASAPAVVRVTEPIPVVVHVFDAQEAGLPPGCSDTLDGVAVGGLLESPDVVTLAQGRCPATRIPGSAGVLTVPVVQP